MWTNQIQIGEVRAKGDGHCFFGHERYVISGLHGKTKDYHGSMLFKSFSEVEASVGEKRTRKVAHTRVIFHHDNALAHSLKAVRAIL